MEIELKNIDTEKDYDWNLCSIRTGELDTPTMGFNEIEEIIDEKCNAHFFYVPEFAEYYQLNEEGNDLVECEWLIYDGDCYAVIKRGKGTPIFQFCLEPSWNHIYYDKNSWDNNEFYNNLLKAYEEGTEVY